MDAEFVDYLGDESMCNPVPTAGAIVCHAIFKRGRSLEYGFHIGVLAPNVNCLILPKISSIVGTPPPGLP